MDLNSIGDALDLRAASRVDYFYHDVTIRFRTNDQGDGLGFVVWFEGGSMIILCNIKPWQISFF